MKCAKKMTYIISIFEDMLNDDGTTNSKYLDDFGTELLSQQSMPLILKLKRNNLI